MQEGECMTLKEVVSECAQYCRIALLGATAVQFALGGMFAPSLQAQQTPKTANPIKHVIIIVGENRTFDHVFATYKPKAGESVDNLLSRKIIDEHGNPGVNFSEAAQSEADDLHHDKYQISPEKDAQDTVYKTLPPPLTGGPSNVCTDNGICTLAQAMASENGLPVSYYPFLLTGGTGQPKHVPDQRIQNVLNLPSGPFQLTSKSFPYDAYAASPVHRFYQAWQQLDCNIKFATTKNPSGCKGDLFPWVEVTVGAGTNGKPQPTNFTNLTTGEGSTAMGFYNVLDGDAPYLYELANKYSMSDNYHQPVMGGTGANSIMLGFGDAIYFTDPNGNPAKPPEGQKVFVGTINEGIVHEIENPNPQVHTNNWYTEDGYGGGGFGQGPVFGGGSYSECSDSDAPGVNSVLKYLSSLPYQVDPKCDPGHYYLLNNYNPGHFGDGTNAYSDLNVANTPFTIPPTKQRSIADVLMENGVSWKHYGAQWDAYLTDKYQVNYGTVGAKSDQYCNICNPFQYQTQIMANASVRNAHLKDTEDLYEDIQSGNLPAVSYVKPSGWVDGHPASSKLNLFEGFVKKIVEELKANEELWESTAIFVTVDEGGGYYDAGYVQPLDFFGDGSRIPLIVVSPYTSAGHISHTYTDHVSILKFIERNWNLGTISKRSRDNLPNPKTKKGNAYVPANSPAIGDLFDLFDFSKKVQDND
jgi:phospholipase C